VRRVALAAVLAVSVLVPSTSHAWTVDRVTDEDTSTRTRVVLVLVPVPVPVPSPFLECMEDEDYAAVPWWTDGAREDGHGVSRLCVPADED